MKQLFAALLSVSALMTTAVPSSAADAPTLTGKWNVHISIAGREADAICTFEQKGEDLTGSCAGAAGSFNVSGKVAEKKVTWTYKSTSEAGPVTLNYRGAIQSPTSITGSVNVEEFGVEGQFTATQAG